MAKAHLLMVMRDSSEVMPIAMAGAAVEAALDHTAADTDTGTAQADAADATAETDAETTN